MTLQADGRKLVNVGNYRLIGKRLGKGNFAKVEEAVHSVLNTKVALKIMDVTLIREDYVVRNLYREARIMSRLFHPCIAALFQTMQFGNLYYLVMELVGGGDLCTFIKAQRHGKLEERPTRIYARQLVSAVAHMHNLGIVHRDLKMENVMLNSLHTQIKIVDFGLSNTYTENNPLRTHCGSPEYAAPELFMEGKQYGPEVDLWSLGVILYGMVIGQLPFVTIRENNITSQERRKRLLEQINKGIAAPHRRALAVFSPDFRTMVSKLLVADSTKRITVKELIFHPWITEKGRKSVRINPMRKLDGQFQAIIMKDVSSLLHLNMSEVEFAIKTEPQGNVAGIYNILSFKQTLNQLEGDGITRNIPDQPINYLSTPRARGSHTSKEGKQSDVKMAKRKETLNSAPLQKTPSARVQRTVKVSTPKTDRPATSIDEKSLKKKMIPKVVLKSIMLSDMGLLQRWEKMTASPTEELEVMGDRMRTRAQTEEYKRAKLCDEPPMIGNGEGSHLTTLSSSPMHSGSRSPRTPLSRERKSSGKIQDGSMLAKEKSKSAAETRTVKIRVTDKLKTKQLTRIQSANAETKNSITSSLHSSIGNSRRPQTGPMHTAERALKRRSMLPVTRNTTFTSSSKQGAANQAATIAPPQVAPPPQHPGSAGPFKTATHKGHHQHQATALATVLHHRHAQQQHHQRRKTSGGEDELVKKFSIVSPTKNVKPFLNEPIARSIADYVVNNIPNKLQTFKWIKAGKKENL